MSVPQKDYETLLNKFKQLEMQLASQGGNNNTIPQTQQNPQVTHLKLHSFCSTKFMEKREDFESFCLHYDAEKSLSVEDFVGWSQSQAIAFLALMVEGEALDVIRASIALHTLKTNHVLIWKDLKTAYKDTDEAEQALQKIQKLVQKSGDLENYICEFNTLCGLTREAATLNDDVILQYFIQGLAKDFCITIAATALKDLATAQADTHHVELILYRRKSHSSEGKPIDTSEGKQEHKFKGSCNWCGYKGHMEREYRQKAAKKP